MNLLAVIVARSLGFRNAPVSLHFALPRDVSANQVGSINTGYFGLLNEEPHQGWREIESYAGSSRHRRVTEIIGFENMDFTYIQHTSGTGLEKKWLRK